MRGLYAIVDVPTRFDHPVAALTRAVVGERARGGPGAGVVQLRAKHATTAQRIAMLEAMVPACRDAGSVLLVNDDVEAALGSSSEVAGVHLGQGDPGADDLQGLRARAGAAGRSLVIGLSTHDKRQLQLGCQQQPDYVALGPIAPTASKTNPDPVVGFAGLLEGCRLATRPLVAIGGLDETRGAKAIELGAAAVAVIGALQHESLDEVSLRSQALARAFERSMAPLPFEQVVAAVPIFAPEQLLEIAKWSDDLSLHISLGLPARFRPRFEDGVAHYRPSDLLDLLFVLDKRPAETWEAWADRVDRGEVGGSLVQLRKD